jgi:N-carbamoylputrescine amidase
MIKIALIRLPCCPDKVKNVQAGTSAVKRAVEQGAQLVCFPELAFEPFYPQKPARGDIKILAETIPGPTSDIFSDLAAKHGITIVINLSEREGEHTYDASPVIDADGKLLGVTRMVHITDRRFKQALSEVEGMKD